MRAITYLAVCALTVSAAAEPPRADCTFNPATYRDARAIRAEASRLAERIAPNASGGGKRRAVSPPWANYPENRNFIDVEIFAKMKKAGVNSSLRSSDTEFLRRITIDLAGRIPTRDEVHAFLADTGSDKRERAIDRLMGSDDFTDRWTLWFGDLVQNVLSASAVGQGTFRGRTPYYNWIKKNIAENRPYDAMVREALAGTGNYRTGDGTANYFARLVQGNGPPQDTFDNLATQSAQQFLAVPMMCVSCHDGAGHLELVNMGMSRVKRRQLWGIAAFFARTNVTFGAPPEFDMIVADGPRGEYLLDTDSGNKSARIPKEGESATVEPQYLDGGKPAAGESRRAAYGRMLTADRQFARAAVNYIWKELFGLGIVEPADSFDLARLTPPAGIEAQPTHPALLEQLTDEFINGGFNLRALIRTMVNSNAYQLSGRYPGEWKETYTPLFARHYPRRMMAEVLHDALYQVSEQEFKAVITEHGLIRKAVATPDPLSLVFNGIPAGQFLGDFGQGNRDTEARTAEPSLLQTLTMLNDALVIRASRRQLGTYVSKVLRETRDPNEITERLYVQTLSRRPTEEELAIARAYLTADDKLDDRAEDLQFVLFNKLEFLFY